jgi:hypothetical protein
MLDRTTLRLSTGLLLGGFITFVVVTLLHTGGPANDHKIIFDDYAGSHDWAAVHLGQFLGMALLTAGLLALNSALNLRDGAIAWVARLGAVFSAAALGLYAALQAVDGVALKQAVDAWVSAPAAEKATRFANAETVRWLEWGVRSYQCTALGLAFMLTGLAILITARVPRVHGLLMCLSGAATLAQGWTVGSNGFSNENGTSIVAGYILTLTWARALAAYAWRSHGTGKDDVPTVECPAQASGTMGQERQRRSWVHSQKPWARVRD